MTELPNAKAKIEEANIHYQKSHEGVVAAQDKHLGMIARTASILSQFIDARDVLKEIVALQKDKVAISANVAETSDAAFQCIVEAGDQGELAEARNQQDHVFGEAMSYDDELDNSLSGMQRHMQNLMNSTRRTMRLLEAQGHKFDESLIATTTVMSIGDTVAREL